MRAETADELDPLDDADADIAALVDEVHRLELIEAGLAAQPDSATMVDAVHGLIEERRAVLERSRRPRA